MLTPCLDRVRSNKVTTAVVSRYRVNWAQGFDKNEPGRPSLPVRTVARILDLPDATLDSGQVSEVNTITSAPFAELIVDGKSLGVQQTPLNDFGEFDMASWSLYNRSECLACMLLHDLYWCINTATCRD